MPDEPEEDDADSIPWPIEPIMLSSDWQEDEHLDEPPVIADEPEHPQWVEAFASREEAEALAARMNASHDDQPFSAFIAHEDGSGGDYTLVTAAAFPTDTGRWAVLVVIDAEAC